MNKLVKTWLREPLLHFLLAGGLLFAAYGLLNRGTPETPRSVRITVAEINWLKETWTRQWQRPPTHEEMRGLVADYLKEVLLAREAKELGLDENDTVIRRRLAQKMEFIVQDTARLAEPADEELRRVHAASQLRYQEPARVSFRQIFFKTETSAQKALALLAKGASEDTGDSSMLERDHERADAQAVTSQFGEQFSNAVFTLEPGRWRGPVRSSYGFHLVRINVRQDAAPRSFEAARAQLREDWQREEQARTGEQLLAELKKKYSVVVDQEIKPLLEPQAKAAR